MRAAVLRSPDRASTVALGRALGAAIEPLPRGGFVVLLRGELGAGKTVLTRGIALGLGVPASTPVVSPTFTFARGYRGRVPLFHLDAYLLRRLADLEASGFEELGGEGRVTVVEWGDRVADGLPPDRLEVTLEPEPLAPQSAPRELPAAPAGAPSAGASGPGDEDVPRRIEVVALGPAAERVLDRFVGTTSTSARGAGA